MDHGVIDAQRPALLQRLVLEVPDGIGKAHAQRQMAAGVFIKEGVIKQQARLIDGGVKGDQSALAQIAAALVHGDELGQQVVVDLGVPLHRLTLVEADPEAVDELTLIAQGLGGVDNALGHTLHGGDEALLRGDIGIEEDALQAGLAAAAELRLRDHAHGEVRAVGALIAQLSNTQTAEVLAPVVEVLVMGLPRRHGVLVHPAGGENGLPQLLNGLTGPQLREQLLGPCGAGDGGDAPLVLVLDLIPVFLDDGVQTLLALGHLLLIDALQAVGILAEQVDAAGDGIHIVLPAGFLVVIKLGEGGQGPIAVVELLQGLIAPVHHHLLGFALIAFLHQHLHKLRLIQIGGDEYLLARLHIDAGGGDQLGIFSQNGLFHGNPLLYSDGLVPL